MSYVDEVYAMVVEKNPAQPEFHQAVKEVLESLRVVIEANEEAYKKDALLERIVTPERQLLFRVPWVDDKSGINGYISRDIMDAYFDLKKVENGEAAWNQIFADWVLANIILEVGEAYTAYSENPNEETAAALVAVYERVFQSEDFFTEEEFDKLDESIKQEYEEKSTIVQAQIMEVIGKLFIKNVAI